MFKSVDTLLKQPTAVRYRKEEIASESAFRILNENFNRSNDIGINLRTGMYANKTIYVDMESQVFCVDYTVSELKPTNPPKLPTGLEESPSRLMMRMKDPGQCKLVQREMSWNHKKTLPFIRTTPMLETTCYSLNL